MKQPTELMEQILTSTEAQKIIDYLSPIYGEAYVFLWMLQSIGVALDEGETAIAEYMKQVTPSTATWTLKYWENQYGIIPDPEWTTQQRQENIKAAMRYRAPINPAKIEDTLSNILGKEVDILENTAKNKFSIYVKGYVDDNLRKKAVDAVDRAKPAHLIYELVVSDFVEVDITNYYGISVTEFETVHINVI